MKQQKFGKAKHRFIAGDEVSWKQCKDFAKNPHILIRWADNGETTTLSLKRFEELYEKIPPTVVEQPVLGVGKLVLMKYFGSGYTMDDPNSWHMVPNTYHAGVYRLGKITKVYPKPVYSAIHANYTVVAQRKYMIEFAGEKFTFDGGTQFEYIY